MTRHPILHVLHRTLDVLESQAIEFAVMGGFAVRFWSIPRPTYDVDFAVAVEGHALVDLLGAFEKAGFQVDAPFPSGFTDVLANTPLVRSAFERRVAAEVEGRSLAVVTAEDLLLFKLLADRNRDRADVDDLLQV